MSRRPFPILCLTLVIVAMVSLCLPVTGADTSVSDVALATNSSGTAASIQQLQDKLQATQLALERSRIEAESAAARNTEFLMGRLESIERSLTSERSRDVDLLQGFQRTMLVLAGVAAAIAILAVAAWAYFQWQSVNHLAEISASLPRSLTVGSVRAIARLPFSDPLAFGSPEQSSFQLRETIDRLEKRVRELELVDHLPQGAGNENIPATYSRSTQAKSAERTSTRDAARFDVLVGKGQSLLSLNQPADALACFEEAFASDPSRADVLVKKGTALEHLGRLDEAIRSYDQAIAADTCLTLAYLQKGGLCNRMQRFTEALECYEQALRHPAKKPA